MAKRNVESSLEIKLNGTWQTNRKGNDKWQVEILQMN